MRAALSHAGRSAERLLSLVPYIGLPLALMPPLFAALAVHQFSTYVLVVVAVSMLHLIALNLLYPKIVGSRVHLNPLVVTFSLMLWGFLWDAPGLAAGDSADRGAQGGLRQRERAAANRKVPGRLNRVVPVLRRDWRNPRSLLFAAKLALFVNPTNPRNPTRAYYPLTVSKY